MQGSTCTNLRNIAKWSSWPNLQDKPQPKTSFLATPHKGRDPN